MRLELIERRQKLLSLRGMGVSLAEAVKELATQYHCSVRAIYQDWANRKEWLKTIINLKDPETFFMEIIASHREIHDMAAAEYLRGDNTASRIGALRLLRDINRDLWEMVNFHDIEERLTRLETTPI